MTVKPTLIRARVACVHALAALLLAACAADNATPVHVYALTASEPIAPALACDAITADLLGVPTLEITQAASVPAATASANPTQNYPEHCVLSGKLDSRTGTDGKPYAIGFELRMPQAWNHRFFFQGGGGTDGAIIPAFGTLPNGVATNALSLGFAVVSTDAGHTSEPMPQFIGGALFGLEPQARIDYGYNAVGTVTRAAKQIIARVYGNEIARSYFVGCSNGGRQAMFAATRFAEEYDGIIAGDPGFQLPKAAVQHAWDTQQLLTIDADSPADAFTPEEMAFIGERITAKCDALDDATDGMVQDVARCSERFDARADIRSCYFGRRTGRCLTSHQKNALRKMISGPVNGKGEALYSDWPWDPGIGSPDFSAWRGWKLGSPALGGASLIGTLGGAALAYVFTTPPTDVRTDAAADPVLILRNYLANFDFDVDAPKIYATSGPYTESAVSFMIPPDNTNMQTFQAKNGKLIVFHGTADPVFSSNDTVRWYEELTTNMRDTGDFARLFLVPGMGHCGGGPSTDNFDMMSALTDWVENDVAPDTVLAHVNPMSTSLPANWSTSRARPLCPYPAHAVLTSGATDLESAASFECR